MELKDVIHYYLGQPYRIRRAFFPDGQWAGWSDLTVRDLSEILGIDDAIIQISLRKLEDLTKEDIDLGDFIPNYDIIKQVFTGGYCMELDSIHDDGYCLTIYPDGSMYCICKDNGENYPYDGGELFRQLLSRGFDLFGLIPSGQAIDAHP